MYTIKEVPMRPLTLTSSVSLLVLLLTIGCASMVEQQEEQNHSMPLHSSHDLVDKPHREVKIQEVVPADTPTLRKPSETSDSAKPSESVGTAEPSKSERAKVALPQKFAAVIDTNHDSAAHKVLSEQPSGHGTSALMGGTSKKATGHGIGGLSMRGSGKVGKVHQHPGRHQRPNHRRRPPVVKALRGSPPPVDREAYAHHEESDYQDPLENPFSTFSTDVDTASFANVRRFIQSGRMPVAAAVRVEEFLNYFDYEPMTSSSGHPVSVGTSWAPCPWNQENMLLQVRVETQRVDHSELPPLNLVYLIDTSGSMRQSLPLLVQGLTMLTNKLRAQDTVSIVTYAGSSGIALYPTSGIEKDRIVSALNNLYAGGSTAGAQGIQQAYSLARQSFQNQSMNRVILATDGDFNVGISDQGSLVRLIEQERESGIFLSVLGFGRGNYQDDRLESIANHGNGQYSYIDSILEAKRVLVDRAGGTLNTVAKDVKLRLEFNPNHVGQYRLIGYDNRRLTTRQFDDDKKDAGDIGAGHMVTALYEIRPRTITATDSVTPRRYQSAPKSNNQASNEWLTAELRYKLPKANTSKLMVHRTNGPNIGASLSRDWSLITSLAEFGLLLKQSKHRGQATFSSALKHAQDAAYGSSDPARQEYVALVARAAELAALRTTAASQH